MSRLRTRGDFLRVEGVLLVTREPPPPPPPTPGQPPFIASDPAEGVEILLAVWDDGTALGLNGHVDLGTGIRTALGQIVAEELDLAFEQVDMVLGDTGRAPNQGPTIASASIQISAVPLRQAAAQARAWLLAQAAERLQVPPGQLQVDAGRIKVAGDAARGVAYGELLRGRRVVLGLDPNTPVKPVAEHRVVGQSAPRVDIAAKAFGEAVFVHDVRLPGMLHGRVVRPPYAGADHGEFIGNTLDSVDERSIAHIPGIRAVVVIRDFVGVVAEREEQAEQACAQLAVRWKPWPGMPPLGELAQALRDNPATARQVVDEGDVNAALSGASQVLERTYVWPYQLHASIGPSCAVADWRGAGQTPALRVYAGSQHPHALRADLSRLLGVPDVAVDVVRLEASGCYGRNGADDVAADAALLSRAVGAPVRVQLTREQENLWEPKGAAQLMEVRGGVTAAGGIAGYDFRSSYPSNAAPTLALLLTRAVEPGAQAFAMGDRTARPPYDIADLRVTINDMAPILRAAWLRGVSALPNSFAHESYMDELAHAAGADPVAFRLRHLKDPRAHELLQATAARAGWKPHAAPQQQGASGDWLHGQGVAYARYVHSKWPGFGAAWSAWVADVDVNRTTGEVHVKRVVVGHDAGLVVNPAGVEHQVHGNVLQTTSRALKEQLRIDPGTSLPASREWGSYPILSFREVPVIEVMQMPRPDEPPLGVGESSSVPGTAAIANAIFDATGVRFRQPPFTPEVVRAALHPTPLPTAPKAAAPALPQPPSNAPWPRRRKLKVGALLAGAFGVVLGLLGWRSAIAPVAPASAAVYTAQILEKGRQLAALGNCAQCHTTPGGPALAGGLAMDTPFGTVYSTNITPDVDTGIGAWSFSAFQRAMREGVARDGHRLYPAFPYTAYTRMTDEDLMALYAWLMSQPPVRAQASSTQLKFPFSLRPLLAGWNALYLESGPRPSAEAARSAQWQRGEYLVNGVGHCGACHTPRNALGAEQGGTAFLSGAMVKGWEAPSLTARHPGPVPWTEQAFYDYLRQGHSPQHGAVGGPMAEVVRKLQDVPEADVRAMAHYLASFGTGATPQQAGQAAAMAIAQGAQAAPALLGPAQRLFEQACGACHHDGNGPRLLGLNVPLALNGNLHSDRPDNLLRTILEGVQEPATRDVGFMPAFGQAFDDAQLVQLAGYMRARFAPQRPAWADLPEAVARARAQVAP
ncbi:MAG: molybdopterin-dependent oxidoreductase [Burkholderiaceae bacterium]|nr:molybdopterin-dependent oxidoreductase [Pseudomonadota bacterium]MBS0597138.1 molybdopterin-dependent oxidoreductase [Pseudomonadota bacterium]MCP5219559.1 molybdopterin-dependent oxidoreductase [Burkholderiaceae bacterium]